MALTRDRSQGSTVQADRHYVFIYQMVDELQEGPDVDASGSSVGPQENPFLCLCFCLERAQARIEAARER
jgi:hypothetical protein